MTASTRNVPPHVPAHLVYDFDMYGAPEFRVEPQRSVARRLHDNAPDIFYSPLQGGYWVVTRSEIAKSLLHETTLFSNSPQFNAAKRFDVPMIPIQADPPEHAEYRRILNPQFTPGSVSKMEKNIRALAREIIKNVHSKGECEFVSEVGERFPVTVFLRLAGCPPEDRDTLLQFVKPYARSPRFEDRLEATRGIIRYLQQQYEERRNIPGDDLLSRVLEAKFNGAPLTDEQKAGIGLTMFVAGLDTVKSALSFIMLYLAEHPEQYGRLVADPELVGHAVEELLRVNAVSTIERAATHDFEWNGISFRRGDRILVLSQLYGMDDRLVQEPGRVDFGREISHHFAFGSGLHRCLGSHLARLEIRVFLQEWTRSFRTFGIRSGASVECAGGVTWSPVALPLIWDAE